MADYKLLNNTSFFFFTVKVHPYIPLLNEMKTYFRGSVCFKCFYFYAQHYMIQACKTLASFLYSTCESHLRLLV